MSKPPFTRYGYPPPEPGAASIIPKRPQMPDLGATARPFAPPPISWPGAEARSSAQQQQPAPHPPWAGRLPNPTPGPQQVQAKLAVKHAVPNGFCNAPTSPFLLRRPGIIQPMYQQTYYSSDEEEEEEDVDYGSDAEYEPEDEEPDPEEFMGTSTSSRPAAYTVVFGSIYSGGTYSAKQIANSMGVKTFQCRRFPCNNKKHGKNCDGFVYVVKHSNFSPTTPVRKKVNTRYTTKLQKPPICHIVDWVIIRDALAGYCGQINRSPSEFEKFLCWGNLDNLTTGRMTCNCKSNKDQQKYTDLSTTRQGEIMNYVKAMVLRQMNSQNSVGYYGKI